MVSDREVEEYLLKKYPPKIMVDKFGHKRKAVWCECACSYELRERV